MEHFDEARTIWQTYVPARGQADTVQGELLRAVEKLRDEAQRNGNVNWNDGHVVLARYLREKLVEDGTFSDSAAEQIRLDCANILDFERPTTSDALYDRLSDRVVEWCRAHPEPITHPNNPELRM